MSRVVFCKFCNGMRLVSASGICHGCSSDVPRNAPTSVERTRRCPKCTDGMLTKNGDMPTALCRGCGYSIGMAMDRQLMMGGRRG
jgi:uncharacterized protein (DUF983 family)